jgi:acetyl esterase/lipase
MVKYFIAVFVLFLAGIGYAFWNLSPPGKLNMADKLWPGYAQAPSFVKTDVAYGKDPRQQLDIFTPMAAAPDDKPRKILVFFHGGSWKDGERAGYAFLGRGFAARGFVTIIADYRKAPKNLFPAFVEDAADAIAWAHKNAAEFGGDPDQLYVMGHSAGAHIAMLAALDKKYLARSGMDSSVIKGIIGLAGPYDFLPLTGHGKAALGVWSQPNETQPITYARGDAPPMLLLTGQMDDVVKPRNSETLDAAITKLGGKVTLKTYSNIGHVDIIMALARPFYGKAPVMEDVIQFLNAPKPS